MGAGGLLETFPALKWVPSSANLGYIKGGQKCSGPLELLLVTSVFSTHQYALHSLLPFLVPLPSRNSERSPLNKPDLPKSWCHWGQTKLMGNALILNSFICLWCQHQPAKTDWLLNSSRRINSTNICTEATADQDFKKQYTNAIKAWSGGLWENFPQRQ